MNKIEVFNEDYYLVNAVIQRSLPHYHHLSEEEQKQALENKKNTETGEVCECSGRIGKDGCIDSQDYT